MATSRRSPSQWVSSKDIPTDVVVEVGDASFNLHKFMLVAKSGLIKRKIMESSAADLARIALPGVPGGAEAFEKAAKFCYGANFEITVHNVVALRCAAEHLEMTDKHCEGNLAGRTDEFLKKAALNNLPSAVVVLRSCEAFLPLAEDLNIVQRCVDAVSFKAYHESTFPTRSPPEWWAYELASLGPSSFQKTIAALRARGAAPQALGTAVSAYAQKSLPGLLLSGSTPPSPDPADRSRQKTVVESIASVLPPECPFPVGFLCCLLRAAIFVEASAACRKELEKRVAAVLDQAAVGDLLTISLDYSGERIADLESLRRVLAAFVESEGRGGILYGGGAVCCSAALQKVARTVDGFCAEIATDEGLSVSKFAGIASVIPKSARRFDDDLYRAVDIFLKAHPGLDEIEREKACSVMDPLKLSYEARLHASQNKRLPVQVVLQSLYYDQLNLRGGGADGSEADKAVDRGGAASMRSHLRAADSSTLAEENEVLRAELTKMKLYVSELQKGGGGGQGSSSSKVPKKPTFFSTVSKTLGKLNPFRQGSKDTSSIDDLLNDAPPKPRRRRFSMS